MRNIHRVCLFTLLMLLLFMSAACGGGSGFKTARVSGKVMMDNKPLAKAEVRFYLIAGPKDQPYASGTTDDNGNYIIQMSSRDGSDLGEGALIGENRVTISLDVRRLGKSPPPGKVPQLNLVPAKYNTESTLKFTVPDGGTTSADFLTLKSK
jgi:hypothetical protein